MKPNGSFRQGLSFAGRLGVEMVVATGIGALLGHTADRFFGTRPWLLAVGVLMGGAAGCLNVYRLASTFVPPPEEDNFEPGSGPKNGTDANNDLKR